MDLEKITETEWLYHERYEIKAAEGSIGGNRGTVYHVYDGADGTYVAQVQQLDGNLARKIKEYERGLLP